MIKMVKWTGYFALMMILLCSFSFATVIETAFASIDFPSVYESNGQNNFRCDILDCSIPIIIVPKASFTINGGAQKIIGKMANSLYGTVSFINYTIEVNSSISTSSSYTFLKNNVYTLTLNYHKTNINDTVDLIPSIYGYDFTSLAWWNSTWLKCKTINITNAFPVNYSHKLVLNSTYINYSSLKANGTDLRFLEGNCTTPTGSVLSDWIENWNVTGASNVWVKTTTANVAQIAMYYNNSAADDTTNGTNTFLIFDDFTDGNYSINPVWTNASNMGDPSGAVAQGGGLLNITVGQLNKLFGLWINVSRYDIAIRGNMSSSLTGGGGWVGLVLDGGDANNGDSGYMASLSNDLGGQFKLHEAAVGGVGSSGVAISANTYNIIEFWKNASGTTTNHSATLNDSNALSYNDSSFNSTIVGFRALDNPSAIKGSFDWVLVRIFVVTTPTYAYDIEENFYPVFTVNLDSPANNSLIFYNNWPFSANASGSASSYNCTLYVNGSASGIGNFTNNTINTIIMNSTLIASVLQWNITCSNNSITNSSANRTIFIYAPPPTAAEIWAYAVRNLTTTEFLTSLEQSQLSNANSTSASINTTVNLINTGIGQINTTVNSINTTVNTINTGIGLLNGSLINMNASIVSVLGNETMILNNISMVLTNQTLIKGNLTQVLGNQTFILNNISSVLGNQSLIETNISFVLGNQTLIENNITNIIGNQSFILGNQSLIIGNQSLFNGNQTLMLNNISLIAGNQTFITGNLTLISNNQSLILGNISFILANESIIIGNQTIMIGNQNLILNNQTLIKNNITNVIGNQGLILGNQTLILVNISLILNNQTLMSNNITGLVGNNTFILGNQSLIIGNQTLILNNMSFVLGNQTWILGNISALPSALTIAYQVWQNANRSTGSSNLTTSDIPAAIAIAYQVWQNTNKSTDLGAAYQVWQNANRSTGSSNLTTADIPSAVLIAYQVWQNSNRSTSNSTATSNLTAADIPSAATIAYNVWQNSNKSTGSSNLTTSDIPTAAIIAYTVWQNANRSTSNLTALDAAYQVWQNTNRSTSNLTTADIPTIIDIAYAVWQNSNRSTSNLTASDIWNSGNRTLTTTEFLTADEIAKLANINATVSSMSNLTAAQIWGYGTRTLTTTEFLSAAEQNYLSGASTLTQAQVSALINGSNITAQVWSYNGRTLNTTEFLTALEISQLGNINANMSILTWNNITAIINAVDIPADVWVQSGRTLSTTEFLTAIEQLQLANANSSSNLTAAGVWSYNGRTLNTTEFLTAIEQSQLADISANMSILSYANITNIMNSSNISADVWNYSNRSLTSAEFLTLIEQGQLFNASNMIINPNVTVNMTFNNSYNQSSLMSDINNSLINTVNNATSTVSTTSTSIVFELIFAALAIVMAFIALYYDRTILKFIAGAIWVGLGLMLYPMSLIIMVCCLGIGLYLWTRVFMS